MMMMRKRAYVIVITLAVWITTILCSFHNLVKAAEMSPLELTTENLSDFQNYQKGWYKSWGGTFETANSSYCSKSFYHVTASAYYIYINDSRVQLSVSEYDSNGKWLKYSDKIQNGAQFTKQADTALIHITVNSSVWGVSIPSLFENGLGIEFSLIQKEPSYQAETIDLKNADFANTENWKPGAYAHQTGEFIIDIGRIAFKSYCNIEAGTYMVNLPGGYLKMNILELDSNGKVIANSDLYSGQKWTKQAKTLKIAITVYTNDKRKTSFTTEEYKALIAAFPEFGLKAYDRIPQTGKMDDLTAQAFINQMNVGWNLGNSLDAKSEKINRGYDANLKQELNWGNPYVTKELIDFVAASGFNTIRIPVTWYYNTDTDAEGNLRIGREWLARVQEVVDYAIANNLYVIINSHHDQPILYAGVSDTEMEMVLANAASLWMQIAEYFKDYDEHLIFEGFNEIDNLEKSWNYSDHSAVQMNQLNQQFVNTVRGTGGNNAKRILMVPTLLDGTSSKILDAFQLPVDTIDNRLIVQVHTYTKKFSQDVDADFAKLEQFSNQIGAPVVIGEFGTTNSYPLPELRAAQASNFVARAALHGIRCIWWDNGSDYSVIDRCEFAKADIGMIQALINGAKGEAYEVQGATILNTPSQFVLKMPNLNSGAVEEQYWGTITTDIAGKGTSVRPVKQCMLSLSVSGNASDIRLQRVLFYDAVGNYLSGKEIQKLDYICDIPKNAALMRVSVNSPYRSITWNEYESYLLNGEMELGISFIDASDIVPVQLVVK